MMLLGIGTCLLLLYTAVIIGDTQRYERQAQDRVRLVGGTLPSEGRVEVYVNGQWGTVCDDYFNVDDVKVVCRMLGYNSDLLAVLPAAYYGGGVGSILLDDVNCTGGEDTIFQCSYITAHNCNHTEDVGVNCFYSKAVRLVGGYYRHGGRIEVYQDGQWETVCAEGFDSHSAALVCTMLGYNANGRTLDASSIELHPGAYGEGSGLILQAVTCTGKEVHIAQCTFSGVTRLNCSHKEDVGVVCSGQVGEPCPSGWYHNLTLRTCIECEFGYYQEKVGQTYCTPCPQDTLTQTTAANHSSQCLGACGPGEQYNGSSCGPCPQDWWNSGNVTQRFEQCVPCPADYATEGEGSTHPDNCTLNCTVGQFIAKIATDNATETCNSCSAGSYQDLPRRYNCTPCPDGFITQQEGSASLGDCQEICNVGHYYNDTNNKCTPCPVGSYQDRAGQDECIQCPDNTTTYSQGSTDSVYCRENCRSGQYYSVANDTCAPCPVGSYQDHTGKDQCIMCTSGTTTISEGSTAVIDCQAPPGVKNTASVDLKYVLLVICTSQEADAVRTTLQTRVVHLSSDWPGMCSDSTCTNAHVTTACEGPFSKAVTAVVQLEDLPSTLQSASTGQALGVQEMLLTSAVGSDAFEMPPSLGAVLQRNEVRVTMERTCLPGFEMFGGTCDCAAGTFKDVESGNVRCRPCPLATYQDKPRKYSCNPCPRGATTTFIGADEQSDCTSVSSDASVSKELIGSIVGSVIGVIAVVLLGLLVYRLFRNGGKMRNHFLNRHQDDPDDHTYTTLRRLNVGKAEKSIARGHLNWSFPPEKPSLPARESKSKEVEEVYDCIQGEDDDAYGHSRPEDRYVPMPAQKLGAKDRVSAPSTDQDQPSEGYLTLCTESSDRDENDFGDYLTPGPPPNTVSASDHAAINDDYLMPVPPPSTISASDDAAVKDDYLTPVPSPTTVSAADDAAISGDYLTPSPQKTSAGTSDDEGTPPLRHGVKATTAGEDGVYDKPDVAVASSSPDADKCKSEDEDVTEHMEEESQIYKF